RGTDGERERSVGEERLVEVADVVGDHAGAGGRQAVDRVDEGEARGGALGEDELGAGGEVVDDLEQRRALVAAAPATARVGGDGDRGQVAGRLRARGVIDAVGDDAHHRAGAVVPA